jgi:hypothetical protein
MSKGNLAGQITGSTQVSELSDKYLLGILQLDVLVAFNIVEQVFIMGGLLNGCCMKGISGFEFLLQ